MQLKDGPWRIEIRRWEHLLDCALWIRAAERIDAPAGGIVPGPLDLDPLPIPSSREELTPLPDPTYQNELSLAAEWLDWWHSLVDAPRQPLVPPPPPAPEPAYDTPDPLGLARTRILRRVVARRWPEARAWNSERSLQGFEPQLPPLPVATEVVRDVEATIGRRIGPLQLEFILLPVRDGEIRQVFDQRYLVPEAVYDGPDWADWLRQLVLRDG